MVSQREAYGNNAKTAALDSIRLDEPAGLSPYCHQGGTFNLSDFQLLYLQWKGKFTWTRFHAEIRFGGDDLLNYCWGSTSGLLLHCHLAWRGYFAEWTLVTQCHGAWGGPGLASLEGPPVSMRTGPRRHSTHVQQDLPLTWSLSWRLSPAQWVGHGSPAD